MLKMPHDDRAQAPKPRPVRKVAAATLIASILATTAPAAPALAMKMRHDCGAGCYGRAVQP